jgi:dTDP-4-dehydrorhamnose 3,5-epimerase
MIELELRSDDRGFLARAYCEKEFAELGLNTHWPQCNITFTRNRGMLRGMHFQANPKPEIKLIRCAAGAVFDVVVDVRNDSATRGRWESFELTGDNHRLLYVPAGFAHGLQCLTDNCQMFYQMSEFYYSDLARGVRWDDPDIGIRWPIMDAIVSDRDRALPGLAELS